MDGGGPTPLNRDTVQRSAAQMASQGLRVLAMAYRLLGPHDASREAPELRDLVFLGLQGMNDPPRAGVREAIAGCREAGVRGVMIKGGHAETGRAIGRGLGITTED